MALTGILQTQRYDHPRSKVTEPLIQEETLQPNVELQIFDFIQTLENTSDQSQELSQMFENSESSGDWQNLIKDSPYYQGSITPDVKESLQYQGSVTPDIKAERLDLQNGVLKTKTKSKKKCKQEADDIQVVSRETVKDNNLVLDGTSTGNLKKHHGHRDITTFETQNTSVNRLHTETTNSKSIVDKTKKLDNISPELPAEPKLLRSHTNLSRNRNVKRSTSLVLPSINRSSDIRRTGDLPSENIQRKTTTVSMVTQYHQCGNSCQRETIEAQSDVFRGGSPQKQISPKEIGQSVEVKANKQTTPRKKGVVYRGAEETHSPRLSQKNIISPSFKIDTHQDERDSADSGFYTPRTLPSPARKHIITLDLVNENQQKCATDDNLSPMELNIIESESPSTPTHQVKSPAPHHVIGGGKMNRPKTAAAVLTGSPRGDCDRVMQVEHEPTRRHNLEVHTPVKRSASSTKQAPPWKKHADPPLVPFVVGPGYILSRSKSKFAMTIRDEFFDPPVDESQKKRHVENERDDLIKQLQQQISDLTLYLEEERLNHRQTKQRADDLLKDKMEEMSDQHIEHIKEITEDHEEEIERVKTQLNMEHNQYKVTAEAQITKMKKEIEFLQGAFESYKSSLLLETNEKWVKKQSDLEMEMEQQKMATIHELKTKWIQEKNVEKIAIGKEHQKSIESIRKEHKKDLDALVRKFSNVAADLERLKLTTEELKETKAELEDVQEAYDSTCQQLANTTRDLADCKVKLMSYEEQFEEKIGEVDEKYKKKIQNLMAQNVELRRLYGQKCGELYEEKISTEMTRQERVSTAKEVMQSMIMSKHNAKVSLGPAVPVDNKVDKAERPGSAPTTKREAVLAQDSAGSFEEMIAKAKDEIIPEVDPLDILPEDSAEVEQMRRLIMEDIKTEGEVNHVSEGEEGEEQEEEEDEDDTLE